jgi:hypothetical protein
MTLESVKILAEVFALAVGGLWAIVVLVVLKQRQKAIADLRKTELELQKIELDLRRIAVVRRDISATSFRLPDGPG